MKTRSEQKKYNAENYPASVLVWLNETIDRAYNSFEVRTCEGCTNKPKENENFPYECGECSRFYADKWEYNDEEAN